MNLNDYTFLYNAAAYFAARERFGADERAQLDAYVLGASDEDKKTAEYAMEVTRLQGALYENEFVALLSNYTPEGFEALCWGICELTNQGELMRRYMGHDPRELLTIERVRMELEPWQTAEAKALIMQAVIRGIRPPGDESAEIDEVLEALQKKTASS